MDLQIRRQRGNVLRKPLVWYFYSPVHIFTPYHPLLFQGQSLQTQSKLRIWYIQYYASKLLEWSKGSSDGQLLSVYFALWLLKHGHHYNGDRRRYIVFDWRSLIWSFGEKLYECSMRHFRARKCLIKRALLVFSYISNCLAATWKRGFSTPGLGLGETWWVGDRPIWYPRSWVPIRSPLTHKVNLLPFLSYSVGYKGIFARTTRIGWQILL